MLKRIRRGFDPEYSVYGAVGATRSKSPVVANIQGAFVQLVGEGSPKATVAAASTPPKTGKKPAPAAGPHVYEYEWNVGVTGSDPNWFQRLEGDHPMVVQVLFHDDGCRFMAREVAATLKQMPPYKRTTSEGILDWFEMLKPFTDTAGKVLEIGGLGIPGKMLSAISSMKVNAVPVDKFPWFIKTFTAFGSPGVEWHIPRALIEMTGNRFAGSVGVYFEECDAGDAAPAELAVEVRAILKTSRRDDGDGQVFLNPTNQSASITVTPVV